jgi:phosphoglycolate phosphatase
MVGGPHVVLVDLDGTLIDPATGIIGSLLHALNAMGCAAPAELHWVIGPPLRDSLRRLLGAEGDVEEAVRLYRTRFSAQGLYEATIYDGIPEALARMREDGRRVILCTSKVRVFAVRILEHFGLDSHFEGIYGAEPDGRFDDKGELIAHILATEGILAQDTCMVGDRKQDVLGAGRHGIPTIGALWGYGGAAELLEAGAAGLCATPADLPRLVGSLRLMK